MFFSIIVPVFNVDQYIEECIDSILLQNCNDYELILIDDGSTDRSGEICDLYDEKYDQIVVIHKENGGLSDARNKGIEISKGEFIGIMGESGSGKTSLLNVLATIDTATAGHIYFEGKDITKMSEDVRSEFRKENLGFIFQNFNLCQHFFTAFRPLNGFFPVKGF